MKISECTCPGHAIIYDCSITGPGTTVWRGSAFNCTGNEITLRHSRFESGGTAGECNNRAIVGYSLHKVDNSYTSRLNISVITEMNGRSVECIYDNGSNTSLIGRDVITITTGTLCHHYHNVDQYLHHACMYI